jgi:hypothetical protein
MNKKYTNEMKVYTFIDREGLRNLAPEINDWFASRSTSLALLFKSIVDNYDGDITTSKGMLDADLPATCLLASYRLGFKDGTSFAKGEKPKK